MGVLPKMTDQYDYDYDETEPVNALEKLEIIDNKLEKLESLPTKSLTTVPFHHSKYHTDQSRDRWINSQKQIVHKLIESKKKVTMLSAPTGIGKSLCCAMAAYMTAPTINYICSDKSLQHQLQEDFPEAEILQGRGNYICNLWERVFKRDEDGDITGRANNVMADTCDKKCDEYIKDEIPCNYYDQKKKVLASKFRILNTHYLLFEMNYAGEFSGNSLLVIDEADTLDSIFTNFVSLQVTDYQLKKYDLREPEFITKVESWVEWAGDTVIDLTSQLDKIKRNSIMGKEEEIVKITKLILKIELFLTLVQDDWIYNRHQTMHEFKPVWITAELMEKYLLKHAKRFILCSASLPPKTIICGTLQIPIHDCEYIEVSSVFDQANRRIIYQPTVSMSYKNRDNHYKMMDAIEEIINKYPDEKGIIHSNSYALSSKIMEIDNDRLISHTTGDKHEQLKEFLESDQPLVFVSPSSARGLSLNDEKGRFNIICKIPYLNLKDKMVAGRLYGSGRKGGIWYSSEAIQTIIQACGRCTRHHDDWSITYILDSDFSKIERLLPKWMEVEQFFDY